MKPELVAPAGDVEKLKVAVLYGADAVYLGGRQFSLRAQAAGFDGAELAEAVCYAHQRGVRVYAAVNIFARNTDLKELPAFLKDIKAAGVDAVIVSDPGVLCLVREQLPDMPVHLSTQANTTNWKAARFWESMGVSRVILARELSLDEIKEIRSRTGLELEVFVHGAMCVSYSGRCLLSSYLTGRDANRGDCAQPCRWRYALVEEKRPGVYLPVEEDERGTYILSSRDLCAAAHIHQLAAAGVSSFKIEGRAKSIHYVAGTVSTYRKILDEWWADPEGYRFDAAHLQELAKVSHRGFTTGFLGGNPGREGQHYTDEVYPKPYTFIGLVRGYDLERQMLVVEQRNRFSTGEEVEALLPGGERFSFIIKDIYDSDGNPVACAPHPQQVVRIPCQRALPEFSLLRRPGA